MNLLGNAIKFTTEKRVSIEINWEPDYEENRDQNGNVLDQGIYADESNMHLTHFELSYSMSEDLSANIYAKASSNHLRQECYRKKTYVKHQNEQELLQNLFQKRKFKIQPPNLNKFQTERKQQNVEFPLTQISKTQQITPKHTTFDLENEGQSYVGPSQEYIFQDSEQSSQENFERLKTKKDQDVSRTNSKKNKNKIVNKALLVCKQNNKFPLLYQQGNEKSGILIVDVVDEGIGISEENQKKLFNPFIQANENIQNKFGGTGLGLWITKQILEKHGGSITLESEVNKGSKFKIKMPLQVVQQDQDEEQDCIEQYRIGNVKVLLVEYNNEDSMQQKKVLESLGCRVTIEKSGLRAYRNYTQVKMNNYDFILMNDKLGDTHGIHTAQRIIDFEVSKS